MVGIYNANTTDGGNILSINTATVATGGGRTFMIFYAGSNADGDVSTAVGSIRLNNNAVAYVTTSDQRLKENIQPTALGLETLMQINVHDFNFITDPGEVKKQGFLAQELYTVYPEAVAVGGDITSPWGVDYGRITPLLIKAVQELNLSLEATAGIATLSTPASESFVTSFFNNIFDKIKTWLADAGNGIGTIFAKVFKGDKGEFKDEICLGESGNQTCINKSQLDSLLAGAGG